MASKGRCSRCGKIMKLAPGSLPAGQRTCQPCRRERRGPYHPNGEKSRSFGVRQCPVDGRVFRVTSQWQKFCSGACRSEHHRLTNPGRRAREQAYQAQRSSAAERGYDAEHARLRAEWKLSVDAGEVNCWRCAKWLGDIPWDLGHDDYDKTIYRGPECLSCNRGTPNKLKARRRGKARRAA